MEKLFANDATEKGVNFQMMFEQLIQLNIKKLN